MAERRPLVSVHVATQLITAMFLYSGATKVSFHDSEKDTSRFAKKIDAWLSVLAIPSDIPQQVLKYVIFCAGLWEIVAVILIEYGLFQKDLQKTYYGSYMLVVFTVAATIVFYMGPNFSVLPFLSNMTTLGALLGLYPYAYDALLAKGPSPLLF